MRALGLIILSLCLCAPALADQKVYKNVGPNGEVTFSDTPSPGATELDVKPAPAYKSPPLPAVKPGPDHQQSSSESPDHQNQSGPGYQMVGILAPGDKKTVVNTEGNVDVTVLVKPPLKAGRGDRLRLLLDGKAVKTSQTPNFSLKNVDRGTHHLEAEVIDRDGNTLMSSSSSTFYLHRPSVHLPGRNKSKSTP